jgi:hypothetical protein
MTKKQAIVAALGVTIWLVSIWLAFAAGLMFQVSSDLYSTRISEEIQLHDWKRFQGQLESGRVGEAKEDLKERIATWTQIVELKRQLPRLDLWTIAVAGFSPEMVINLMQVERATEDRERERRLAKGAGH